MNIGFASKAFPKTGTLVLTVSDKGLGAKGKELDKSLKGQLTKAMKAKSFKGAFKSTLTIVAPAGSTLDQIILLGTGELKNLTTNAAETLGGVAAGACKSVKGGATLLADFSSAPKAGEDETAAYFAVGCLLRSYRFDKYKTKKAEKPSLKKITLGVATPTAVKKIYQPLSKVSEGVFLARDLVNEPANVLHPPEFA